MAKRLIGLDIENPNYKHGYSKSKLYKVYYAMLERCYNKNCKRYSDYGARGITVSKDWLKSFCCVCRQLCHNHSTNYYEKC